MDRVMEAARARWNAASVNTKPKANPKAKPVNTKPATDPMQSVNTKTKSKPVNTKTRKPVNTKDRSLDRHSPGYMREYMRQWRAAQKR
jgi:hypothetical protein